MCSSFEAGSYLRLIDFVYHTTLGLRVIKKKKKLRMGGTVRRARLLSFLCQPLCLLSRLPQRAALGLLYGPGFVVADLGFRV